MVRDLFSDALPDPLPDARETERALTVSELTAAIKGLLEMAFPAVWVSGEICDLARPQSGHCYLTLKDAHAQLAAILWRGTASRLRFELRDGLEVTCRGRLDVYAPRGKYQLIIDQIEPRGIGALELALRQLHAKLAQEGLFEAGRKRPLPRFVRRVAVVTSPSGAALRDFLEVLRRRWRAVDVLVVPVRVQGEGAAEEIAAAIQRVNVLATPLDCLAVIRGGGSLEDLWAFNAEVVVRAICGSRLPVVSGIGHEIDVTLADLAADVRALTPSEAAERIAPAAEEVAARLGQYQRRMAAAQRSRMAAARQRLATVAAHRLLRRPLDRVHELARRIDELGARAARGARRRGRSERERIEAARARLEALNPLAVLGRGYSLTRRADDGRIVRDASLLEPGALLHTRYAQGQSVSRVEKSEP